MSYIAERLGDQVFATLRDRIIYLEYPPDTMLSEQELTKEFKVSRAPLREAIRKLEEMHLVKVIPRFGTQVTPIDINEIRCAFEVKKKLEALAASLAVRRMSSAQLEELASLVARAAKQLTNGDQRALIDLDTRFHEIIYAAAQNPILTEFLENLHARCARLWGSILASAIHTEQIVDQLERMREAIEKKDEQGVARLMEGHVQYFIDAVKDRLL